MKKSLGARTIAFPTPVWVVGTYDKKRKPNAMTAAWVGICCSKPPCVSISLRKATYTYSNIMERKAFTISIPSKSHIRETDYFGIVSGRDVDKFAEINLTPVKSDLVDAPYIAEFPLILECKVIHIFEIGLHTQFIGEIMDIKADLDVINEKELPNIEKIKPVIFEPGNRKYYSLGKYIGQAFSIGKIKKDS